MKTILVVDDSPLIRKAIRRIVEPLGFAVEEAGNGAEAMQYVETRAAPDLILLDVEMPEMDGISFLKALRNRPELPQPPIVMCTSRNSVATIAEALQAGANEYIMKPFDGAILGAKLEGIGLVA